MTSTSTSVTKPSPLEEANPLSLQEIFNKDPLELLDRDIDATIEYYRAARETFLKNEAAGIKPGKKAGVKKLDAPKDLKVEDLDFS